MRDNQRRFGASADLGIRLIILVLVAVLLMALQQTGRLGTIEGAVALVMSPGQQGLSSITDRIVQTVSALGSFQVLQERTAELESINRSLLAENLR